MALFCCQQQEGSMNLMDHLVLSGTQLLLLRAELLHAPLPDQSVQAKVELKLRPEPKGARQRGQFSIYVQASVNGKMGDPGQSLEVFRLEVHLAAAYQQEMGEAIGDEAFAQYHASLARQLYPLLQAKLTDLLAQLGLGSVHLPPDLTHLNQESPDTRTAAQGQSVH
jgi:hypothetical protein